MTVQTLETIVRLAFPEAGTPGPGSGGPAHRAKNAGHVPGPTMLYIRVGSVPSRPFLGGPRVFDSTNPDFAVPKSFHQRRKHKRCHPARVSQRRSLNRMARVAVGSRNIGRSRSRFVKGGWFVLSNEKYQVYGGLKPSAGFWYVA